MSEQIVLTGREANMYSGLKSGIIAIIKEQAGEVSGACLDPVTDTLLELMAHVSTLHAYIREAAMWLDAESCSTAITAESLSKAKDAVLNADLMYPQGTKIANWSFDLSIVTKVMEVVSHYSFELK